MPQHRGRPPPAEKRSESSGKAHVATQWGSASKFTVLGEFAEEDEVSGNIAFLKKQIRDLPGPSHLSRSAHARAQGKKVKGKATASPKAGPVPPPTGSGAKSVISSPQPHTANGLGRPPQTTQASGSSGPTTQHTNLHPPNPTRSTPDAEARVHTHPNLTADTSQLPTIKPTGKPPD